MAETVKHSRRWVQFSIAEWGILVTALAILWAQVAKDLSNRAPEETVADSTNDEGVLFAAIVATLVAVPVWLLTVTAMRRIRQRWLGRKSCTH